MLALYGLVQWMRIDADSQFLSVILFNCYHGVYPVGRVFSWNNDSLAAHLVQCSLDTIFQSLGIRLGRLMTSCTSRCDGVLPLFLQILSTNFCLLVLLASVLASAKPAWLNFGQHRGPTYSYNDDGSKKRQNWWVHFTISIANNNHNTKGHRVINTKDLNTKLTCCVT